MRSVSVAGAVRCGACGTVGQHSWPVPAMCQGPLLPRLWQSKPSPDAAARSHLRTAVKEKDNRVITWTAPAEWLVPWRAGSGASRKDPPLPLRAPAPPSPCHCPPSSHRAPSCFPNTPVPPWLRAFALQGGSLRPELSSPRCPLWWCFLNTF